jgi:hypothetical protein
MGACGGHAAGEGFGLNGRHLANFFQVSEVRKRLAAIDMLDRFGECNAVRRTNGQIAGDRGCAGPIGAA